MKKETWKITLNTYSMDFDFYAKGTKFDRRVLSKSLKELEVQTGSKFDWRISPKTYTGCLSGEHKLIIVKVSDLHSMGTLLANFTRAVIEVERVL